MRTPARPARSALISLVAVLAAAFVVPLGLRVLDSGPSHAAPTSDGPQAVAEKVTLAFLDVDYRDMEPRLAKVLDLATGTFHEEYQANAVNLTAAAQEGLAVSSGRVLHVGLSAATATTATVLVAADSTVANKLIAAERVKGNEVDDQRYYRFQIDLTLVSGRWLVNQLQFVA